MTGFESLMSYDDCWAVVVNDTEVLVNRYREKEMKTMERINELVCMEAMKKNALHMVFHHLFSKEKNGYVDVYKLDLCNKFDSDIMIRFEYSIEYDHRTDKKNKYMTVRVYTDDPADC